MKHYYNILMIFTHLHDQDVIEENTVLAVEKALAEAFNELEHWQKEMLWHTISFEVSEVICH
jgi:hypothetical protein